MWRSGLAYFSKNSYLCTKVTKKRDGAKLMARLWVTAVRQIGKMRAKYFIGLLLTLGLTIFGVSAAQQVKRQSREQYVERYAAIAVAHMERYGIPASITLAQGILESDCGNSFLSRTSNNHFGIKCKKNWTGAKVYHDDDEKGECFRAYPTVEASYEDHAEFLATQPRYDSLFAYSSTDYHRWARGLKAAGYATAPDYAERLVRIIEESRLYRFDNAGSRYDNREERERFEHQSSVFEVAVSPEGVEPDRLPESISLHRGYPLYRNNGILYVLAREGDCYEHIAELFQISARNLRRFNGVKEEAQPLTGEVVYVERKAKYWRGPKSHHEAVEGETCFSVAQRYGIREQSLRRMNGMSRRESHFEAGTQVRIRY